MKLYWEVNIALSESEQNLTLADFEGVISKSPK
jgi:hypothetical protein